MNTSASSQVPTTALVPKMVTEVPNMMSSPVSEPFSWVVSFQWVPVLVNTYDRAAIDGKVASTTAVVIETATG